MRKSRDGEVKTGRGYLYDASALSERAFAGRHLTSDDIGSALKRCCRVSKATWTGLQRGSSMSRFLLADSLVTVGSSVLLYVLRLTEKTEGRYERLRWFGFALVNSSFPPMRSCSSRAPFLFLSTLSSRPPPLDLCLSATSLSFSPLSFPAPLCYSVFSLSFSPHPLCCLHPSLATFLACVLTTLSTYPSTYLSVFLSKHRVPHAPRAPPRS